MKTTREIKKYLVKQKREAKSAQAKIPEVFNDLEDAENWNYYEGYLTAIYQILDYIKEVNEDEKQ